MSLCCRVIGKLSRVKAGSPPTTAGNTSPPANVQGQVDTIDGWMERAKWTQKMNISLTVTWWSDASLFLNELDDLLLMKLHNAPENLKEKLHYCTYAAATIVSTSARLKKRDKNARKGFWVAQDRLFLFKKKQFRWCGITSNSDSSNQCYLITSILQREVTEIMWLEEVLESYD